MIADSILSEDLEQARLLMYVIRLFEEATQLQAAVQARNTILFWWLDLNDDVALRFQGNRRQELVVDVDLFWRIIGARAEAARADHTDERWSCTPRTVHDDGPAGPNPLPPWIGSSFGRSAGLGGSTFTSMRYLQSMHYLQSTRSNVDAFIQRIKATGVVFYNEEV